MRRVDINFYDPPFWQVRQLGIAILAVGILLSGVTAWYGLQAFSEHSRWDSEVASLRQEGKAKQVQVIDSSQIALELKAANQIIVSLNTPWADLFSALETVYSEDAVLLGAEPDPVSRQVRLTAEARNTDSMLEYVRQLRASKILADAFVVSHVVNLQDMQRPVRFLVSSHWLDLPPSVGSNVASEDAQSGPEPLGTVALSDDKDDVPPNTRANPR